MKYKMVIIGIICLILLICAVIFIRRNKEIKNINTFNFYLSGGMATDGNTHYQVKCNYDLKCGGDTKCINQCSGSVKIPYRKEVENVTFSKDDMNQLTSLLNRYKVSTWDGFKKSNKLVKDGNNFSIKIKSDTADIYASGYMRYPRHYREVKAGLDEIFGKYVSDGTLLFDNENYKDFNIDNVSKIKVQKYTEGGMDTSEITDKGRILEIYNEWKDVKITDKTDKACEDNTTIYTFIMNDGKEYKIEIECEWLVIGKDRYDYKKQTSK